MAACQRSRAPNHAASIRPSRLWRAKVSLFFRFIKFIDFPPAVISIWISNGFPAEISGSGGEKRGHQYVLMEMVGYGKPLNFHRSFSTAALM